MPYSNLLKKTFDLNKKQLNQFGFYYNFLIQENQKFNLTTLTSLSDVYCKHFYDSLILKNLLDFNAIKNLCDVGSGAGFPSFPLKILYPHLKIFIIESSLKKIGFLKQLAQHLSFNNISFFHQRVEKHVILNHNQYDCVIVRALGSLSLILKWCVPLIKQKSYFIAMKGKKFAQELEVSKNLFKQLKINLVNMQTLELPMNLGTRTNLLFQIK